ncbi:MAG: prepilin-type N-terminal cleavage/methylation domain-containing protein [Methylococcaceae bacterium]
MSPAQGPRVRIAHHDAKGFTLIEVLIAMTLLSIMVVLLFASLSICSKSWEKGESKITEVNEVAVVYNFFQRYLTSAIPLWNDFNDKGGVGAGNQSEVIAAMDAEEKTFSFQGKKQSLQFVSFFPASAGRSGMQLFSIESFPQDNEQLIKVTLTPFFPITEGEVWNKEEVVLLKHVSDFTLSYFGAGGEGGESSWQEEWLAKSEQPRLVKISINTTNSIYWPPMIIALKGSGSVSSEVLATSPNESQPVEGSE